MLNIDINEVKELEDLFTEFLEVSYKFDLEKAIEEDYEMIYQSGNNTGTRIFVEIKEKIKNHSGEIKFQNGDPMNKYYSLYHLLTYEISFINRYKIISKKMVKEIN